MQHVTCFASGQNVRQQQQRHTPSSRPNNNNDNAAPTFQPFHSFDPTQRSASNDTHTQAANAETYLPSPHLVVLSDPYPSSVMHCYHYADSTELFPTRCRA